jgi:hypothetical protein
VGSEHAGMPTPTLPNCIRIATEPPYDGPYDVDCTGYLLTVDGGIAVYLGLGKNLDFYRLEVVCTLPPSWELWHVDSAVCHVDPAWVEKDVVFQSALLLSADAKELRVVVKTAAGERTFLGAVILVETRDEGAQFELTFRLTEDTRLVFDRAGWTLHHNQEITRHHELHVSFSKLS